MPIKLLAVAVAAVCAGFVYWYGQDEQPAPTPPAAETDTSPAAPAEVQALRARVPEFEADASVPREQRFLLPDGTWARSLNGATNAPAMGWPTERPYAPIVGTEFDTVGIEWYVHADGSKSTTRMWWRKDLGRYDAVTDVANPEKVALRDFGAQGAGSGEPAAKGKQ